MRFNFSRVTLLIALLVTASRSAHSQSNHGAEAQQLKNRLNKVLTDGWIVDRIETGSDTVRPWGEFFPDVFKGYAVYLEQPNKQIADAGGKHGAAGSLRHPQFWLWLMDAHQINRNSFDQDMLDRRVMQSAHPVYLGSNPRFFVACLYDCSSDNPQVFHLLGALKVKSSAPNP